MPANTTIRLATRGSALALKQADLVAARIAAEFPDMRTELRVVITTGDLRGELALADEPEKHHFVTDIEAYILGGEADAGVHSMKDLPTVLPSSLRVAAVVERADAREALVSRNGNSLQELPHGAVIGTSSLRRKAQLLRIRPDLRVKPLRGNVDTRLRKLDGGGYDAIVVAAAGLDRLGLSERISQRIPTDAIMPAPAQGALAVEAPAAGPFGDIWPAIDNPDARLATEVERFFCISIGAGCHSAVGCLCTIEGDRAEFSARVCSPDGRVAKDWKRKGDRADACDLAKSAAADLIADGAAAILQMGGQM